MSKIVYGAFGVFEYEYMESMLEDMGEKGFFLKKKRLCFWEFEKGEPRKVKYRIIPQVAGKIDSAEVEFYEELGWKYITSSAGLGIFLWEGSDREELFTDRDSYEKRCRSFKRGCIAAFLSFLLMIIINIKNFIELNRYEYGAIHMLDETGPLTYISLFVLVLAVIVLAATVAFRYLTAYMRLKKGLHRKGIPYKRRYYANSILYAASILIALFCMGCSIFEADNTNYSMEAGMSSNNPVSIEALDDELYKMAGCFCKDRNSYVEGYEVSSYIREYSSLLFDRVCYAEAEAEPEGKDGLYRYFSGRYYEAAGEDIAEKYVAEEVAAFTNGSKTSVREITSQYKGTDEVWQIKDGDGCFTVIARKGQNFEIVMYKGNNSIDNLTEAVVSDL